MPCSRLLSASLLTHLFIIASTLCSFAASSTCYYPNGATDANSTPCDPGAEFSHCCENTHTCLSNRLCWDVENNHIVRASCTDSTYSSPACPRVCLDSPDGGLADIRQCNNQNTDWVCSMNVTDCSNNFTLPWGYVDDQRTSELSNVHHPIADNSPGSQASSAAVQTTTVVSIITAAAATGDTALNACASDLVDSGENIRRARLAAGLGVGLGAVLPLLAALIASLMMLQKAKKENKKLRATYGNGDADALRFYSQPAHQPFAGPHVGQVAEMDTVLAAVEVPESEAKGSEVGVGMRGIRRIPSQ